MRAISIIYRRELGAYLRSPLGYVVGAIALLISGFLFQSWALGKEAQLSAQVLRTFFQLQFFSTAVIALVLSFRLVTEERSSHTMVLLNTSPVRDTEIILGKFFAALTFLCGILLFSVYMPLLIKVNGKISAAEIFVGYLGLLFLGSAILAIGLFASALGKELIVAAVVAVAIAVALGNIFQMAQVVEPPLKDAVKSLDLWMRYQGFMGGVFNLKDAVYYGAVTYFFLLLSVKTLEAQRWQ